MKSIIPNGGASSRGGGGCRRSNNRREKSVDNFICWKCEENSCLGYQDCKFNKKLFSMCNKRGHSMKSRYCKGAEKHLEKENKMKKKKSAYLTDAVSTEDDSEYSTSDTEEDSKPIKAVRKLLNILRI